MSVYCSTEKINETLPSFDLTGISLKICMRKTCRNHYSHQDLIFKLILKAKPASTKCFITLQHVDEGK